MSMRSLAILVALVIVGCAHGRLEPPSARIPAPVGRVAVAPVPGLAAERIDRYRELDGDGMIREAIERELSDAGAWQPGGDVVVAVTVSNFRLRSAGNAFWNGFLAGSDLLDGQIDIQRGDAPPERIVFKLSGNEDLYLKFSATARLRSLSRTLAREIRARVETH